MTKVLKSTIFLAVCISWGHASSCPAAQKYTSGPRSGCTKPSDPLKKPASGIESWFTKEVFNDLFPKANLGWGPDECFPYSYEAFVIAARYFPNFGTEKGTNYTAEQNARRDLAAFFSHAVQETGENDASLYQSIKNQTEADGCFYRGGFFNWFEGGPVSSFLPANQTGSQPSDGDLCASAGQYCVSSAEYNAFYPCYNGTSGQHFKGCYFGRGAIQISYNYNYGQFQDWLKSQGIVVDLLKEPNLVITKMDPPLAIMASLWFYMTPQPPKPAMHDIVIGNWNAGETNIAAKYNGAIFGPTSLIINNECNGEDSSTPGGPGESRRIKAFKWFCKYFDVPTGANETLSCKYMAQTFASMKQNLSYQPDWSSTWKDDQACQCTPASYGGLIPYYDPDFYPKEFSSQNDELKAYCQKKLYESPAAFSVDEKTAPCLKVKP
ncbi:unnamed protein product [Bursaphelenchus xylophilus]|uniref:(pine wood nematode) hypothetical protein n=1 Tax=Bursaphelenchus xylophilus TaxID=6326 RepID=A0A1I7S2L4_BURXY|nr:unnamed protein product [Bursaphelenchus xylophilus]CAG9121858.1 unnamed protein product [Bursaphelenchus xylophilus]